MLKGRVSRSRTTRGAIDSVKRHILRSNSRDKYDGGDDGGNNNNKNDSFDVKAQNSQVLVSSTKDVASSSHHRQRQQRGQGTDTGKMSSSSSLSLQRQADRQIQRGRASNSGTGNDGNNANVAPPPSSSSSSAAAIRSKLESVRRSYGPNADVYADVLGVSPTSTNDEIREAYFRLRYEIYKRLDRPSANNAGGGGGDDDALASDEKRREVEERMEAIASAFYVVGDPRRREAYDNTSGVSKNDDDKNNDDDAGVRSAPLTPQNDVGHGQRQEQRPSAEAAVTSATTTAATAARGYRNHHRATTGSSSSSSGNNGSRLPIGQRRSTLFRRQRGGTQGARNHLKAPVALSRSGGSGMNESREPRARSVGDDAGLNARPGPKKAEVREKKQNGAARAAATTATGTPSPEWTAAEGSVDDAGSPTPRQRGGTSGAACAWTPEAGGGGGGPPVPLPPGVDGLNAREQVLMRSQAALSQQRKATAQRQQEQRAAAAAPGGGAVATSRLGSRYDADERGDKYSSGTKSEPRSSSGPAAAAAARTPGVRSPTGVEQFDAADDDDGGDDSRTCDDGTSYACDDTATFGTETVGDDDTCTMGDSTWASCEGYDDDDDTEALSYLGGKYSPGHKKGNTPTPILRSAGGAAATRGGGASGSMKRRVTIHSHRGRGEDRSDDDFDLFFGEGGGCPAPSLPSFQGLREEIAGTYKDFTSALHQVSNAFVISPDDIDRMADKIRDAKIELGENYQRQVAEQGGKGGGGVRGDRGGGKKDELESLRSKYGRSKRKEKVSEPKARTLQL